MKRNNLIYWISTVWLSLGMLSTGIVGDGPNDFFGPGLLLILTMISWYFRPSERKTIPSI